MASATELQDRFQQGLMLHQSGQLAAAERICELILLDDPAHSDALLMLGFIAMQTPDMARAAELIGRAVAIDPQNAPAHFNHGIALESLGQHAAALTSYSKAAQLAPDAADAHGSCGNMLLALGQGEAAVESYARAIKADPRHAIAYNNRSVALNDLGRSEDALASANRAIEIKPDYADAHNNRGLALRALRRSDAACASFEAAIRHKPDFAVAHNNLGLMLAEARRDAAALASYDKAIALKPHYAEAHNNRGNTLLDMQRRDEALASYDKAISLKPAYADPHQNRGHALAEMRRFEEAIVSYDQCLHLRPDHDFLYGARLNTKMMICDWRNIDTEIAELARRIKARAKATPGFATLALTGNIALQRRAAEIWVDIKHPANESLGPIFGRRHGGKIRVGYFSADFRDHPLALLMAGVFEAHDRSKFETYAFSFGPDTVGPSTRGDMRARLERAFDKFIDVRSMPDRDVAALARTMGIDIAIDLTGFTQDARTGIFAHHAAPMQVNYLGYPGTMGAPYIDYILADAFVIPAGARAHYSEKVVWLDQFQANDNTRAIAPRSFTRAELGLPANGFVFCCFNNTYKINPDVFGSWMRILQRVPGSVLFLYTDHETAAANLRKEASARGIDATRLVFGKRLPMPEYLARYRAADLFLDTLPYNAGTTASDALWAGLPVLTCAGESFAGRMAGSLLRTSGLPELVTSSAADYENLAVSLATDPARLAALKQRLADGRLTSPLFNTAAFAKNLEEAYTQMYIRHQSGLPPGHLNIAIKNQD